MKKNWSGDETSCGREKEVKIKSLVQNNTLVPLLHNLSSEDTCHQLAASSDAGNYCCSCKKLKFTLSKGNLLCVACCSICNQDKNGVKQSTSILLVSHFKESQCKGHKLNHK